MPTIETPNWSTGSSYAQQAAMVELLAKECGATVLYKPLGERDDLGGYKNCIASVIINGKRTNFTTHGGITN